MVSYALAACKSGLVSGGVRRQIYSWRNSEPRKTRVVVALAAREHEKLARAQQTAFTASIAYANCTRRCFKRRAIDFQLTQSNSERQKRASDAALSRLIKAARELRRLVECCAALVAASRAEAAHDAPAFYARNSCSFDVRRLLLALSARCVHWSIASRRTSIAAGASLDNKRNFLQLRVACLTSNRGILRLRANKSEFVFVFRPLFVCLFARINKAQNS